MASSLEAFEKLRSWKKRNTVLRVTIVESGGRTEWRVGQIFFVDEETFLVGVVLERSHDHFRLDLGDAFFTVGKRALEAKRAEDDFVAFEEV